jgi:hypothetical protein
VKSTLKTRLTVAELPAVSFALMNTSQESDPWSLHSALAPTETVGSLAQPKVVQERVWAALLVTR